MRQDAGEEKIMRLRMAALPSTTPSPTDQPARFPEYVCWSRMQAEAGQSLEAIIARKEVERQSGNGLFLWGVGNAPTAVISLLAKARMPVRAIFSVMKSRPKKADLTPSRVVVWRRYIDAHGTERPIPSHALVASRGDSPGGAKKYHYALMCHSDEPLILRRGDEFDPNAFRNAGGKGAPVGSSQVTALLRRTELAYGPSDYEANLSAWLTESYWVKLIDPVEIDPLMRRQLEQLGSVSPLDWSQIIASIVPPSADLTPNVADRLL